MPKQCSEHFLKHFVVPSKRCLRAQTGKHCCEDILPDVFALMNKRQRLGRTDKLLSYMSLLTAHLAKKFQLPHVVQIRRQRKRAQRCLTTRFFWVTTAKINCDNIKHFCRKRRIVQVCDFHATKFGCNIYIYQSASTFLSHDHNNGGSSRD